MSPDNVNLAVQTPDARSSFSTWASLVLPGRAGGGSSAASARHFRQNGIRGSMSLAGRGTIFC